MSKNALTFTQKTEVAKLLADVIRTHEDADAIPEGQCRYSLGHSDQWICDTVPFTCTVPNVASLRKELYGTLCVASASEKSTALAMELRDLANRVVRLEQDVASLIMNNG